MKQPVHLKKSIACQLQAFRAEPKKTFRLQMLQRSIEAALHIDSELLLKIRVVHMAEFHLEHELPNHTLVLVRRERPPDRERALMHLLDIRIPVMLILIVRAADVRERGDAEPDHIGAAPQQVAVEKSGRL